MSDGVTDGRCQQPDCGGRLVVYTTRINFTQQIRIRYCRCEKCKAIPEVGGKRIVPLKYAPARLVP